MHAVLGSLRPFALEQCSISMSGIYSNSPTMFVLVSTMLQ
jgi:hypothetical protein